MKNKVYFIEDFLNDRYEYLMGFRNFSNQNSHIELSRKILQSIAGDPDVSLKQSFPEFYTNTPSSIWWLDESDPKKGHRNTLVDPKTGIFVEKKLENYFSHEKHPPLL